MSRRQENVSPVNDRAVSWWIRITRWLWKLWVALFTLVVLALVVNITSTWLTTSKGEFPNDAPLSILIMYWPITLSICGCLFFLAALCWVISRRGVPQNTLAGTITLRDREHIIRRLHVRYEQIHSQSLQGVAQIELGLVERPAAIHNEAILALRLPEQADQVLPPHTSIVDAYNLARQELLILGEPGAGKSTLLLQLARHLIKSAEQDTKQHLPVLLPLSSWANKRLPLQEWFIEQFAQIYQIPRQQSREWIEANLVLPLLDGLDEMDASARSNCIKEINMYHRKHLGPIVICSRTQEYQMAAAHEKLTLHTAIVVQPLSREQVEAHLTNIGEPLAALYAALQENTALQTVVTTPLLLQILLLTYHDVPVRTLPHREAQLREQIWTDYVQRMVTRKGNMKRYPLDRTKKRLSWLARQMQAANQTIFFLEILQPYWLPETQEGCYWGIVILLEGLLTGLLIGLLTGLLIGLLTGLLFGLLFGVVIGLLFGLARTVDKAKASAQIDVEYLTLELKFFLLLGLLFGVVTGLIGGPLVGLLAWSVTELVLALVGGPVLGLVIGLLFWLGIRQDAVMEHYILRIFLACSHLFPWKAVSFLEDATARILLRREGEGYSFIHGLLLEYFADLDTTPPSISPDAHLTQQPPLLEEFPVIGSDTLEM